jgi:hypothetical protein
MYAASAVGNERADVTDRGGGGVPFDLIDLYRVEGDLTILAQMAKGFPPQATRRAAATMGD